MLVAFAALRVVWCSIVFAWEVDVLDGTVHRNSLSPYFGLPPSIPRIGPADASGQGGTGKRQHL